MRVRPDSGLSSENCALIWPCACSTRPTRRDSAESLLSSENSPTTDVTRSPRLRSRSPWRSFSSRTRRLSALSARSSENSPAIASLCSASACEHLAPHRRDELVAFFRAEQRLQRAVVAQMLHEQLVERPAGRLDLAADHRRQFAVLLEQALNTLGERPAGRVEVAAQRAAERLVEQFAVLDHALLERAQQPIALLPNRGAIDGSACGLERQDADLQRGQCQFLAVTPIGDLSKRGNRLRVRHREVQVDGLGGHPPT